MISLALEIILPFILSFLVVIIITVLAERYGTKAGGIVGTLPSTIIIAFLFIAINRGIPFTTDSITVAIPIMAMNLFFLTAFALLITRSLSLALLGSFLIWTIGTVTIYIIDPHSMLFSQLFFFLAYLSCFWILEKYKKIPSQHKIQMSYSARKLLIRGLLAGTVIATAVVLSNINAALSGILAMFPAIFLSTMLIAYLEHGPDFTRALAKAMVYGSLSVTAYGITIYLLYPVLGIVLGTIAAVIISLAISGLLYLLRPALN